MDDLDLELERGSGPDTINEPDEEEDVLTQEEMDQILGFDEEPVFEDEEPELEQPSLFDRLFGTKEERRKAKEKQKEKKKWQKEAAEKLEAEELEYERQEYERLQRDRVESEANAEAERVYEEQDGYEPTREPQMDHVPEPAYNPEADIPVPQEDQSEIYNDPETASPYDALFAEQEPEILHPTYAEQPEENHTENDNAFVHGESENGYVQAASDDHSGLAGYDEPVLQQETSNKEDTYHIPEDETVQSTSDLDHKDNEPEGAYDDRRDDEWQEAENQKDAGWTEQTEGERDKSVAGQAYESGSDGDGQHMEETVMPTSDNTSSPYDALFVEPEQKTVEAPVSEKASQAAKPDSTPGFVHGTESGYVQMDSGNMIGITGDAKILTEDDTHVNESVVYPHRQDQHAGCEENVHIQTALSGISDPHISQQDHEKITRDAVISETEPQAHNESDYRPSQDRIEYETDARYVPERNTQKAKTSESYSIPVKTPFEQLFRGEPEVTVLSERQAENVSWSPVDMPKDYGNSVLPDRENSTSPAMPVETTVMDAGVDSIAEFDQIAQMARTLNDTVQPTLILQDKEPVQEYKTPGGFDGSSGKEKKESEISSEENAKSKEKAESIEKESKDSVLKDLAGTAKNALEMMGSATIQSVRRSSDGEANYGEGKRNLEKVVRPILQSAAVIGARGVARNLKNEANNAYLAAKKVDKLMGKGDLSVADLADKKVLKGKLKDIGINPVTAHNILKNREFVRDSILLKEAFMKMQASKGDIKEAVKTIDRIKSNKTLDFAGKDTATMLKEYFAASNNQKIKNIGSLSDKKLKQMLKNPEKFKLTELDKSAIRVLTKQRKLKKALIKANQLSSTKRLVVKIGGSIMGKMDDAARAGVENLKKGIMISFGVVKTGIYSVQATSRLGVAIGRAWERHTFTGKLERQARQYVTAKIKEKAKAMAGKMAGAVRGNARKAVAKAGKTTAAQTVRTAKAAIKESKAAVSAVEKLKQARELGKKLSKQAGKAKMIAKKTGQTIGNGARVVNSVGSVVFAPLNFVKNLLGKAFNLFNRFKKAIFIVCGGGLLLYMVIVLIVGALIATFQTQADAETTIILSNDDNFVADHVAELETLADARKQEAEAIAKGKPQDPNVHYGETIDRYGHPDASGQWTDGSKIVYLDASGYETYDGADNSKDAIVMAYVMTNGNVDADPSATSALIKDLWELMNPDITYKESEIYACPLGCDAYHYHCNVTSDYETMTAMRTGGVMFYQSLVPQKPTDGGCQCTYETVVVETDYSTLTKTKLKKLCKERDIPYTTKTTKAELIELLEDYDLYNPQTTVETRYYCPSHSVSICYGHKDIEVYITVKNMWDVWDSGEMPSGSSYTKYIDQFKQNGGWNESAKSWAESLYNQDWLSAYGTDPSGSGMPTGSGLSPEEIAAITSQYGDVDAARTAICSDAMSFVGAIPYYWGGKSTNPDFAANHFGTTVKADYKGRTKKGLDCSGFVNWILLRNFGHAYGWSTRDTTTNLKQINRSQLQPGDIGLENPAGSSTNHIGFFVGYNHAGQAMWCHCSGGAGGVTVNTTTCFRLYYSLL